MSSAAVVIGTLRVKRICSNGNKFFSIKVDPTVKGDKKESGIVAYPGSVPIHIQPEIVLLFYIHGKQLWSYWDLS